MQGEDCDFRGAVQPEGNSHCTDATIDVKLHVLHMKEAFGIVLAHGRQDEWSEEGKAYLAAVSMASEHEIDKLSAGMLDDCVGVVGLMRHQQDGRIGQRRHGEFEARVGGAGVIDSAEPEAGAVALDCHVLVDQDGNAICSERADDERSTDGDVVVAKAGVTQRTREGVEDLGATMRGVTAGEESERSMGDEVSGKQNHVRAEGVDMVDDSFEKGGFGELVKVDIADLNDAEPMKRAGKIGDSDAAGDEIDLMAGDLAGIKS